MGRVGQPEWAAQNRGEPTLTRLTGYFQPITPLVASEGRGGETGGTADLAAVGDHCRRTRGVEASSHTLLIDRGIRSVRSCPGAQEIRSERTISHDIRLRHELHLVTRRSQGVVGGCARGRYVSGDGAALC